jgi:hypothetical protein
MPSPSRGTGHAGVPGEPLPHVLREYSLIADGERGALIGPRGEIVWMCAPAWHSDAVFSALIGGGGSYVICPADPWFVWGGYYEEATLIWHSRFTTTDGVVECREALAFPGEADRAVVLRRVNAVEGASKIGIRFDPRAGFGKHGLREVRRSTQLRRRDGAVVEVLEGRCGPLRLRWSGVGGARRLRSAGGAFAGELTLQAGDQHDVVLELSDRALPDDLPDPDQAWAMTEDAWAKVAPQCPTAVARRDARHAYAVLRGLTSASGGMVAAATMSLPERAESGRNYDYRYAWVRDQCYAGLAFAAEGPHELVAVAADFVAERLLADGPQLKPAYLVGGGSVPAERQLSGLRGYPGGADKAGNWVNEQFQLDSLGEILQLLVAAGRCGQLTENGRRAIDVAVRVIEERWQFPDAGIWELEPDWWAHSRLECVAGLRTVAASASEVGADAGQAAQWGSMADAILAETARRCTHPTGRWQRSPTDERVDAALLAPPVHGALQRSDPRTIATIEAVKSDLTQDGYVYRYRHRGVPLAAGEGAFALCGFMMCLALLDQGDISGAVGWFERNRAACGPPGLLSEEYDVTQRQMRGNLPQAFVHAALLESSVRIGRDHPG